VIVWHELADVEEIMGEELGVSLPEEKLTTPFSDGASRS
jgi:hypothetical protein